MGATYKLKRKLADGTLEDVVLQGTGGGVPFISSSDITVTTGTGAIAQKWAVADVGGITTATDGMTVAVRMPTGGSSYGVNLSIDGGNTYYPIVQNANTLIRMTYSQGSTLILTFNASQTVNAYMTGSGMTKVTGCWQTTDIDTNNQVSQYHTTTDDKFPLIFKYSSGVTSTSTQQAMARYANNMYVNPSTGTITATEFNGRRVFVEEYDDEVRNYSTLSTGGISVNQLYANGNSSWLNFNIVDGMELSQSDGPSAILNGGFIGIYDAEENSLEITPSAITHNGNEYQFPNKSGTLATLDDIATSGGGVKKLTSATTSININSNVVGAYFKVFGTIEAADELTIGSNSIGLDSEHTYFVSVEGNLFRRVSDTNYWNIMVTLKQHEGIVSYSSYYITSTSGFNISDTGQPPLNSVSYSGILYE